MRSAMVHAFRHRENASIFISKINGEIEARRYGEEILNIVYYMSTSNDLETPIEISM